MSNGYITFALGGRTFALPLPAVREIVRLGGLLELPGMAPSMAGVLDLRGFPLPVMDLRADRAAPRGDVLVVEGDGGQPMGVAVDRVLAVLGPEGLTPSSDAEVTAPVGLPSYVVDVLRDDLGPVFLVDVRRMLAVAV